MVLDLLELSRLEAGVDESHQEPVVPAEAVKRIATRYGYGEVPYDACRRSEIASCSTSVAWSASSSTCSTTRGTTPTARRASPSRTAPATRCAWSSRTPGPGVPPNERDHIFERFYRGTEARRRVGTGLGLALVSEHATAMGGRAWVEDRRGGGARFVVSLPAVRA